jgi:hypothetical protein
MVAAMGGSVTAGHARTSRLAVTERRRGSIMFDDDDVCDDDCETIVARMSWWDVVVAFFAFINGVCRSASDASEIMLKAAIGAGNHAFRQDEFEDAARRDIDSIPVVDGEDG